MWYKIQRSSSNQIGILFKKKPKIGSPTPQYRWQINLFLADWNLILVLKTKRGWRWWCWWWWWWWWLEPLRKPAGGEPWQLQVLLHLHCPHCSPCLCIPSDVSNENKRWRHWTIRQAKSTEEAGGTHSDDSSCFFLPSSLSTPHLPLHFLSPPYLQPMNWSSRLNLSFKLPSNAIQTKLRFWR